MKYLLFIFATCSIFLTSCNNPLLCEKEIQGVIRDKATNEPLANVEVTLVGFEEIGDLEMIEYPFDPIYTDENGEYRLLTRENINRWEYTYELEEYIGANEEKLGVYSNVPCGALPHASFMKGISYIDLKITDDIAILGNRVHYETFYPTSEKTGTVELGETIRIPAFEDKYFKIDITIFDSFDNELSDERIVVELEKGEIKTIEYGI